MKAIICCLFFNALLLGAFSQSVTRKDLLGEWSLVRNTMQSDTILDIENPTAMMRHYLGELRRSKRQYTEDDSLKLVEGVYKTIEQFKSYTMTFNKNKTYSNSQVLRGGGLSGNQEKGAYEFIKSEQKVILNESSGTVSEMNVSQQGDVLILWSGDRFDVRMEFRKKKK